MHKNPSLFLLAAAIAASVPSMAKAAPAASAPDYSLTIYSSAAPGQLSTATLANYGTALPGYALVRDSRPMELKSGQSPLRFTDVAKRIDPTTVSFASLTDPAGTRVIEQNYQFDLVSQEKLMERFIGETITVEQVRGEQVDRITGRLLSAAGALILAKDNGEVLTLTNYSNVAFPSLPGGLITRPTLVWLIDTARAGVHQARVSYQTQGMTWWSDYNVTLREGEERCDMDLSAWVTIVNQAGGSFPAAQIKLVAGEVNRAPAAPAPVMLAGSVAKMARAEQTAQGFAESSLFEYHLYTLGRRADLPDNSTKQLELFPAATSVACRKNLIFTASPPWSNWGAPIMDQGYGATTEGTVGAYLEFDNREANHLGMPLPAGRVRVNQANRADGALEFIGEDSIKHTPRNETLKIKLGNSFDVVGERRQVDFKLNNAEHWLDETFELSVRNRKKTAATVIAREYLYRWSDWTITTKNHDFDKRDANTVDFPLTIAADGEVKVRYTVRYSWK